VGVGHDSAEGQNLPAPVRGAAVEVSVQSAFGHALDARDVDQFTRTLRTIQAGVEPFVQAFHRDG